jgi:hypothetical protein
MIRNLTSAEIESILSKKKFAKAKRIAVENFLMTLGNNRNIFNAYANLEMDARLYSWNAATCTAINKGIEIGSR